MRNAEGKHVWEFLKRTLTPEQGWTLQRLETKQERGWPDVHWLHSSWTKEPGQLGKEHTTGWVELKYLQVNALVAIETEIIPDELYRVCLRPEQAVWLYNYARAGGHCGVLLGIGTRTQPLTHLRYYPALAQPSWATQAQRGLVMETPYQLRIPEVRQTPTLLWSRKFEQWFCNQGD